MRLSAGVVVFTIAAVSCKFEAAYRDVPDPGVSPCTEGVVECRDTLLTKCENGVRRTLDDCGARGMTCATALLACTPCQPDQATCEGFDVLRCSPDGQTKTKEQTCDTDHGYACREGVCTQLCQKAAAEHSNVGCEYWGVDLDNIVTNDPSMLGNGNAAEQQYAIIVSNAEPDLAANVVVDEVVATATRPYGIRTVAKARVGPHTLEVFKLGPKEVDGSAPGTFNTGNGTALSPNAFRVRSDVPLVAYQFNPLENVNVFSNDAALLFPTPALGGGGGRSYVVAGWPQTLAITSDPSTNWGINSRAFLTVVGTTPNTHVHLRSAARIVPGDPAPNGVEQGGELDAVLQPFDVLNLETGDFNADFTGSLIDSDAPVAVFVGSEASDSPFYSTISERACCADHLETQLAPIRASGKRFAIGRMPNRTKAIAAAGGAIAPFDEPEMYRVVAAYPGLTHVKTSLDPPFDAFDLDGEGAFTTLVAHRDFLLDASQGVIVADVQVSQEAAGVVLRGGIGLPGGDPSLSQSPPIEQWRSDYTLLTPDKYSFDFLVFTAPVQAHVFLDGLPVDGKLCETSGLPGYTVYRCQLSFPAIDPNRPSPTNVSPGRQNDGVHRVQADYPIGVVVYGFDLRVSYAYAGGTELKDLNPR